MGFSSISEVGSRIVSILRHELVPDVIQHPSAIGICSPEDHGDLMIGVYLYDIGPNNDFVERGMVTRDRDTQVFPSTFLTLRYIITAWSMGDQRYKTQEEHRILGRVIQALSDYSVIGQTSALYGQPMDTRIEMERIEPGEKLRIWNFPNKAYQLSLFYRAQPVEITSTRTRLVATRVRDIRVFLRDVLGDEVDTMSSGRTLVVLCVDGETGRPVQGSAVRLVMDHASRPILKEDSYRIFTHIEGESTVIHCTSAIYEPADVDVDLKVWDGSKVLEITLQPGPYYPRPEARPSFEEEGEGEA